MDCIILIKVEVWCFADDMYTCFYVAHETSKLVSISEWHEWKRLNFSHIRIKQRRKLEARNAETTYQEQFKAAVSEAARPFVMVRTDRFVDELELFLAAGLNMEAYDAIYKQRLGWNRREIGAASEEREEVEEHNVRTRVTPYLFIFEEDSDWDKTLITSVPYKETLNFLWSLPINNIQVSICFTLCNAKIIFSLTKPTKRPNVPFYSVLFFTLFIV